MAKIGASVGIEGLRIHNVESLINSSLCPLNSILIPRESNSLIFSSFFSCFSLNSLIYTLASFEAKYFVIFYFLNKLHIVKEIKIFLR